MLCGTDFNIGGIKGIGPKKAIGLVRRHGKNFEKVFEEVRWGEYFGFPWKKVYDTIKEMPVTDDYKLVWRGIDEKKIYSLLSDKHEFSKERVEKAISELAKKHAQRGLGDFF